MAKNFTPTHLFNDPFLGASRPPFPQTATDGNVLATTHILETGPHLLVAFYHRSLARKKRTNDRTSSLLTVRESRPKGAVGKSYRGYDVLTICVVEGRPKQ